MWTTEQIKKLKTEKNEFFSKCESLARQFIPIPASTDSDKPLDKEYLLFERVVSTFQEQLRERWKEQAEETTVLLRNQFTTFTEGHQRLIQYVAESVVITEVLQNWYTYYGQVFGKMKKTHELINSLQK